MFDTRIAFDRDLAALGVNDYVEGMRGHRRKFHFFDRLNREKHFCLFSQHLVN